MGPWSWLDIATRKWWRLCGRPIDLLGAEAWLDAPMHSDDRVGEAWVAPAVSRFGGTLVENDPESGLVSDLALLDGPGFDHAAVDHRIRDFYEHTAAWRMDVWSSWNPLFLPAGALIARWFGRRVHQLAIPIDPLKTSRGMDSRVIVLLDADRQQESAAWIRTLRSTGEYVYSGRYAISAPAATGAATIHVTFPLEAGNVQVFLCPENDPDKSLWLRSPRGSFGDVGAYVVVRDRGQTFAAKPPLSETFHVFVDEEGTLRTDHELRLWGLRVVRLHYRLERRK